MLEIYFEVCKEEGFFRTTALYKVSNKVLENTQFVKDHEMGKNRQPSSQGASFQAINRSGHNLANRLWPTAHDLKLVKWRE